MMRVLFRPTLLIVLLAVSITPAIPDDRHERGNSRFDFALIGDVPYGAGPLSAGDEAKFDRVIDDVNHDHSISWVLHVGDIKSGSSFTTDELVRARFALYQKFRAAFIFTPGDNEWTDAHRVNNGQYNPLERLAFLRSVFYPTPGMTTGGRPMRVRTQAHDPAFPEFVENQLWAKSRVVFAAIHVVGSHNNLDPWSGIDPADSMASPRPDRLAEYTRRLQANLAWIDEAFEKAADIHARGVFIFMQANPEFESAESTAARQGFNEIINRIAQKTVAFGKPVVVAHGDTHYFRLDKPLMMMAADAKVHRLENLTRVETFGAEDVHWVRVTVDPDSRSVFFIDPVIVDANRFPR